MISITQALTQGTLLVLLLHPGLMLNSSFPISKSCQLYLQIVSRIWTHLTTSTAITLNETKIYLDYNNGVPTDFSPSIFAALWSILKIAGRVFFQKHKLYHVTSHSEKKHTSKTMTSRPLIISHIAPSNYPLPLHPSWWKKEWIEIRDYATIFIFIVYIL